MSARTVVVVGAGISGVSVASALREQGFDGTVILIGDEPELPYDRPPLSKSFLTGDVTVDAVRLRTQEQFADEQIDLRVGSLVTSVDPDAQHVRLASGDTVAYDDLVLCTGTRARRPPIPGLELDGVFELRTLDDAERIRSQLAASARVAVLGLGFIGSEVAASLAGSDRTVIGVDSLPGPLWRLGRRCSDEVRRWHDDHGVTTVTEAFVHEITRAGDNLVVTTQQGSRIECDLVIFGFGCVPATSLAASAGLAVDDGVVTDAGGRTSVEHIWAIGDVARHYHPLAGRHVRVEHWQCGLDQAPIVATNILGGDAQFHNVHWMWSDHYDHIIHHATVHRSPDQLVERVVDRGMCEFGLLEDRLVSVTMIDQPRLFRTARTLMQHRTEITSAELRSSDNDLRSLL